MLERKSLPDIEAWLAEAQLPADLSGYLQALPRLNGDVSVLDQADQLFSQAAPAIRNDLRYLRQLVNRLQQAYPDCQIHIDLAEVNGYDYHTGIVYGIYTPGLGREIARGGRYDGIGEAFGRKRPATGFSTDLRNLAQFAPQAANTNNSILAPAEQQPELEALIKQLRQQGKQVVRALAGQTLNAAALGCNQQIIQQQDQWVLTAI
jgi:ATP phosphoribosyltransferase regulatory subunit